MSHRSRQARIGGRLADKDLDALIVTDPVNVRYLSGFVGSNGVLVVTAGHRVLLTDSRYTVAARAQVVDTDVVIAGRDLLDSMAEVVPTGRVGIEADHMTVARRDRMASRLRAIDLVPVTGIVEGLRVVKDPGELDLIREATRVADAALARLVAEGFAGRTEAETAWALHGWMRDLGAEGASFDIIVAGGAHGALPHAVPRGERIPPDTLVVVDMGARIGGYASDCTRTLSTGILPPALEEAYAVCREAHGAALAACRAGVHSREVDSAARNIITAAGLGDRFGHGLGHGVGLDIHERPWLRQEGGEVLQTGMVVTIEPGIYLEGVGGVRIEDLAVVGDDGCEVLTCVPTDLITTTI